ncbi:hypothetical protein [Methanobacterium formicicum]|uniref:Nickel responsive regulator n=1 Tax=Methanobacterium formicicum (strain DSM 3637 / PP1) TaxID=1204725 RepID=K2R5S5_METFP|nr:hypothetical protein [Methanobacterium formicicum]EKF86592.1 nickel responsive regulator [Methanobacterium formicicum DSM 3637]
MRLAINLPNELVKEFDEILKENGYNSRNKGLQEAINQYMERNR